MTLKEKFLQLAFAKISSEELIDKSAKLAEDFAIEFADWMRGFRYDNAEIYHISSTKELLEIYKKEKGL